MSGRISNDPQQPAGLGHLHQPEEERHDAHQAESEIDRAGGRLDHGPGQRLHGRRASGGGGREQLPPGRGAEGDQDNGEKHRVHGMETSGR
ncbi:MAG: hypothetical protein MUE48_10515 [Desulfobacterales bacterium]|nr:hypothetical protein [Desulfobacterales bacterium]